MTDTIKKNNKDDKVAENKGSDIDPAPAGPPPSDFHEPCWSVVSFEKCLAANLTYDQAVERVRNFEKQKTHGLCIITDAAAQRISG